MKSHQCYHQPLPLSPLSPIPTVHQVHRHVRSRHGQLKTRLVLEPTTTVTPTGIPSYVISKVLSKQQAKNVTLFLASPIQEAITTKTKGGGDSTTGGYTCTGPLVVIKASPLPPKEDTFRPFPDHPLKEIAALQHLSYRQQQQPGRHHHVIPLLHCMQDNHYLYLVLPHLPGGDLHSRVEDRYQLGLPDAEAASYLLQIVHGLLFMKQTCQLAHHDVSLDNMMLDGSGRVSIIDLGMAVRVPDGVGDEVALLRPQRCQGKPCNVPPELVRLQPWDPYAADIWSLGSCLYTMLTGRNLYVNPSDPAFKLLAIGEVQQVLSTYQSHGVRVSPLARNLICLMLNAEPTKRPTLEQVLDHPFLREAAMSWNISPQRPLHPHQPLSSSYGALPSLKKMLGLARFFGPSKNASTTTGGSNNNITKDGSSDDDGQEDQ